MLDQVVAAAEDDPPFTSVRHLTAPNATACKIDSSNSEYGEYRWECIWQDRNLSKFVNKKEELRKKSEKLLDDLLLLDPLDPKGARVEREFNRVDAEFEQMRASMVPLKDALYSQAQTLVTGIKECFSKGAVRGSWEAFEDHVSYRKDGSLRGAHWSTCQDLESEIGRPCLGVGVRHELSLGVSIWVK